MGDPLGQAIHDHHFQNQQAKLWIHNMYGAAEEMPVSVYFRDATNFHMLETIALEQCSGTVLDIGAGAGAHAIWLQEHTDVTALEISPLSCEVMADRGIHKILNMDIRSHKNATYDTLLLLMNGIGLVETLAGLKKFLVHAKTLIRPGGSMIFDSSDVAYLYEDELPADPPYYGEIAFQYEYKKQLSNWFHWLYVDRRTLAGIARDGGWRYEFIAEDEHDQYLARLWPIT
jgi:SAM-dependent methyltransferase